MISPLPFFQVLVDTGEALLRHCSVTLPPKEALSLGLSISTIGKTEECKHWRLKYFVSIVLTLNTEIDPFTYRRRNSIAGNAEVGATVVLLHAVQHEGGAANTPHTLHVEVARHNVPPVLPPPEDLRRGVAAGLACQVDSLLLPHHEVVGTSAVYNAGGH